MAQKYTDEEFVAAWQKAGGSPQTVAEMLGLNIRAVYHRRNSTEDRLGITLTSVSRGPNGGDNSPRTRAYDRQHDFELDTGSIIIFSDAHWWPHQERTPAHRALIKLIQRLKPRAVVANGDVFDGARVSRHAPMGWVDTPTVRQELDVCLDNMNEIVMAAPKSCHFQWTVGNHDQRFDRMLATQAGEYADTVDRLPDRFPEWKFAWSFAVNNQVMIKHRIAGGIHSGYNNTLKSGWTTVTGHTHTLEVKPWADYNGRRWGVQTGTLSDMLADQFEYTENNPSYSGQGFAVLTYRNGVLLPPELCEVIDGIAYFRGEAV